MRQNKSWSCISVRHCKSLGSYSAAENMRLPGCRRPVNMSLLLQEYIFISLYCLRVFVLLEAPALKQMACKPAQGVCPNVECQRPPLGLEWLPEMSHELDTRCVARLEFETPAGLQFVNHLGQVMILALFTHLITEKQRRPPVVPSDCHLMLYEATYSGLRAFL